MSAEEMKRLGDDIKSNTALAEEFKGISDVDAFVAKAGEKGYRITAADVKAAQASAELNDDELDAAAGGVVIDSGFGMGGGSIGIPNNNIALTK